MTQNNSKLSQGHDSNTIFVGREHELEELASLLRRTASGSGGLVLIEGDRGSGKTSLVKEFLARSRINVGLSLEVVGSPSWGDGLSPFVEPLLRLNESSLSSQFKGALERAVRQASESSGVLASLLNNLLHAKDAGVALSGLEVALGREEAAVFYAYARILEGLEAARPLILWVEDLQWLDRQGLGLVEYLGRRTRTSKVLVISTYRSSYVTSQREAVARDFVGRLKGSGLAAIVTLGGLSREQVQQLVETTHRSSGTVGPKALDELYRRTEGNPFFVNAISTLGALDPAASPGWPVGGEFHSLPEMVERAILAQLKASSPR